MPGKTPGEAVDNFLNPIKTAISVLGNAHLGSSSNPGLNTPEAATINQGDGLRFDSSLYGRLTLRSTLNYVAIACDAADPRGPYRCSSRSYIHSLYDDDRKLLMALHWHPLSASEDRGPHCHIGPTILPQAAELHIPTPRQSVEEFIITIIDTFGAATTVEEELWRPLLEDGHAVHAQWREWEHRSDAPTEFPNPN